MKRIICTALIVSPLALAGCTSVPMGPTQMALPGQSKSFEQFKADDQTCRQYAEYATDHTSTNGAAGMALAKNTATGTAMGAAAGAAAGNGKGAAIGAAAGMLAGAAAGAVGAMNSSDRVQQLYDNAYTQCMYAKGERVQAPASSSSGSSFFDDGNSGSSQPQYMERGQ